MTISSLSPQVIKGGLVLLDSTTGVVQRIIILQSSPDSLSRTLQPQGMGENAERSEILQLKGSP